MRSICGRDILPGTRGSRYPELPASYPAFRKGFRESFFHGQPVIAVGVLFLAPVRADDFNHKAAELPCVLDHRVRLGDSAHENLDQEIPQRGVVQNGFADQAVPTHGVKEFVTKILELVAGKQSDFLESAI